MTATEVEVQVSPAPSIDVDVQFGDEPQIDVAVQIEPPTFTVMSVLPTGPRGPAGPTGADGVIGADGPQGDPGVVQSIVPGTNVTVDDTDPANPIVASTAGGGTPDPHAASHADGGSDEVALDASQITTGTLADGRIPAAIARDAEVTAAVGAEATARDAAIAAHQADTTAVHGIADTAALVLTGDLRLSDARTPTAHATSHQDGGSDELALDGSQITSGTVADARIASTLARDSEVTSAVAAEATARDVAIAVHVNDATDAHDAVAVSFAPTVGISATDVQAAIEEVAAEAGSGSLDDAVILAPTTSVRNVIEGVGDVTELTLKAEAGQTAPLLALEDEDGQSVLDSTVYPSDGALVTEHRSSDGAASFRLYSGANDDFTETTNEITAVGVGITLDSYVDKNDATQSYTTGTLQAQPGQTAPLLDLKDENGVSLLRAALTSAMTQLLAQAAVGQEATDHLLELKDENGDELLWVNQEAGAPGATMRFVRGGSAAETLLDYQFNVFSDATWRIACGNRYALSLESFLDVVDTPNSFTTFNLTAQPDQTAPMVDLRDETINKSVLRAYQTGAVVSNAHAEPPDASLSDSDHVTWLDDTAGAPLLMVKAKDSAGDVFTASIPLTPA